LNSAHGIVLRTEEGKLRREDHLGGLHSALLYSLLVEIGGCYKFKGYPSEILTHKSTLLYFQGHIHRFMKSPLFIDRKKTSTYLGKEIKNLNSEDIFVIDIAMLSSLEEQSLVIGDACKDVKIESVPISFDETYRSDYDTKRLTLPYLTLEFARTRR
jgi:hypothetical protein